MFNRTMSINFIAYHKLRQNISTNSTKIGLVFLVDKGGKFWKNIMVLVIFKVFNRRWHISTTPNTTKNICTLFKLIQRSNMVTLSYLAKKIRIWTRGKKSSVYYWKWRFLKVCGMKTQLSVINWNFLREATQGAHIRWLY